MELDLRRQFFAEEIEAVAKLRSPAVVAALAAVPRERFLPPGPWTVLAEADFTGPTRYAQTIDADPKRVYHNIAVAIDPARQLFNGQPATLAAWIDALDLTPGARVLHVGAGLGYYTAVMAHCAGTAGRVVAYEVDEALAIRARENLSRFPWVDVRHGDASQDLGETFDAILVNAGTTHPLASWLDSLGPAGKMMLPLTADMPAMGSNLGKGLVWLVTRGDGADLSVRVLTVVAIYSALGLRDSGLNEALGKAMMSGPARWQAVKRLRRETHEPHLSCWLHGNDFCFST